MKIDETSDVPVSCGQLQAALRDEEFLHHYASKTDAITSTVEKNLDGDRLVVVVRRRNSTHDIPKVLRKLIGEHADVVERSIGPAEIDPAGCATQEFVEIVMNNRGGTFTATGKLEVISAVETRVCVMGDLVSHGVPRLLSGAVEGEIRDLIVWTLKEKLRLAAMWPAR